MEFHDPINKSEDFINLVMRSFPIINVTKDELYDRIVAYSAPFDDKIPIKINGTMQDYRQVATRILSSNIRNKVALFSSIDPFKTDPKVLGRLSLIHPSLFALYEYSVNWASHSVIPDTYLDTIAYLNTIRPEFLKKFAEEQNGLPMAKEKREEARSRGIELNKLKLRIQLLEDEVKKVHQREDILKKQLAFADESIKKNSPKKDYPTFLKIGDGEIHSAPKSDDNKDAEIEGLKKDIENIKMAHKVEDDAAQKRISKLLASNESMGIQLEDLMNKQPTVIEKFVNPLKIEFFMGLKEKFHGLDNDEKKLMIHELVNTILDYCRFSTYECKSIGKSFREIKDFVKSVFYTANDKIVMSVPEIRN